MYFHIPTLPPPLSLIKTRARVPINDRRRYQYQLETTNMHQFHHLTIVVCIGENFEFCTIKHWSNTPL